jgi:hypothetical protein
MLKLHSWRWFEKRLLRLEILLLAQSGWINPVHFRTLACKDLSLALAEKRNLWRGRAGVSNFAQSTEG